MKNTKSAYEPSKIPKLNVFIPPSALAARKVKSPYDLSTK